MKKKRRRLAVTLIEMIIVMILIATITGVLAVSYRGMLEKGNAFKTEQRIRRLEAILTTYFMEHPTEVGTIDDYTFIVKNSPLAGEKAEEMLRDGWGKPFEISVPSLDNDDWQITINSKALIKYRNGKNNSPKNNGQ
jgi:type II secretory pathway pseudopilin PulG